MGEFVEEKWERKALDGGREWCFVAEKCEVSIIYEVEIWKGNEIYECTVQDKDSEYMYKLYIIRLWIVILK